MCSNNAHAHTWAAFSQLRSVQSGREDKTNQPEASTEGGSPPSPGGSSPSHTELWFLPCCSKALRVCQRLHLLTKNEHFLWKGSETPGGSHQSPQSFHPMLGSFSSSSSSPEKGPWLHKGLDFLERDYIYKTNPCSLGGKNEIRICEAKSKSFP